MAQKVPLVVSVLVVGVYCCLSSSQVVIYI